MAALGARRPCCGGRDGWVITPLLAHRSCSPSQRRRGCTIAATHPDSPDTPPPYSSLSTPVYSLATVGGMNLVTYASPVSLKPRHYAVGLYVNTLSWENCLGTRHAVLQVCLPC